MYSFFLCKFEKFSYKINELMKYTDLVMLDLKQTDTEKHKERLVKLSMPLL